MHVILFNYITIVYGVLYIPYTVSTHITRAQMSKKLIFGGGKNISLLCMNKEK